MSGGVRGKREPCQYSGLAAGLTQAHRAIHHYDTSAGIDGKTTETLLRGLPNALKCTLGLKSLICL